MANVEHATLPETTLGRLTGDELRSTGKVSTSVYFAYFSAAGGMTFIVFIFLSYVMVQGVIFGRDFWLKQWASMYGTKGRLLPWSFFSKSLSTTNFMFVNNFSEQNMDVNYYLMIYGLLGLLYLVVLTIRLLLLYTGSFKASKKFHEMLLTKILGAKMRFYDTTPIGRIINRFSKDMQSVDQELAPVTGDFLANAIGALTKLIIIGYLTPSFLYGVPAISFAYFYISKKYLRTSTELKRLGKYF